VQGWVLGRADRPARGRLLRCGRPRHAAPPPPPLMLLSASNWCADVADAAAAAAAAACPPLNLDDDIL